MGTAEQGGEVASKGVLQVVWATPLWLSFYEKGDFEGQMMILGEKLVRERPGSGCWKDRGQNSLGSSDAFSLILLLLWGWRPSTESAINSETFGHGVMVREWVERFW